MRKELSAWMSLLLDFQLRQPTATFLFEKIDPSRQSLLRCFWWSTTLTGVRWRILYASFLSAQAFTNFFTFQRRNKEEAIVDNTAAPCCFHVSPHSLSRAITHTMRGCGPECLKSHNAVENDCLGNHDVERSRCACKPKLSTRESVCLSPGTKRFHASNDAS